MLSVPDVSVCIPVYNGERFLEETLRSVLDQTLPDFELVVLDNASTDRSVEIVRRFAAADRRVRLERNRETLPQAANWNRAVELARAPLVKLLCADDLLHPRCLERQVAPMEADPGLAVVAARRHMIDETSRVIVPRRGLQGMLGVRSGVEVARRVVRSGANPIGEPGGVLFRRDDFVASGGWRGDRRLVMDLDLWMRLVQHGDFLGQPEPLAAFRIGRDSVSARNEQAITEEQRELLDELSSVESYRVRGVDRFVGRLLAPLARVRRQALFAVSRRSARRAERAEPVGA